MSISSCSHVAANGFILGFFCGWVVFHHVYIPHLLNPFISWWTFGLFPCLGYCEPSVLWTLGCMCLFKWKFCLDICPGVGLLDHVVVLFFNSMNFITFIVVQQSSQPNFITFPFQTPSPYLPPHNLSPSETISFSKSVSQYLFCKEVHCILF